MKRLFRIDESEKNRILGMHKTATSKQYLKEQTSTGQTETEEVAFDCNKIDEVLEKPDVKKWVEKITGPAKWTIRKGSEKLLQQDGNLYTGVTDVIKIIQCKLGIEPSGIFDNESDVKLREFQKEKFGKDDGKVGPQTWGAMFAESQEPEETPSANKCYMAFGEEGIMIDLYENRAKAARKKDDRSFYFFDDGTVIVWQGNAPMGGTEANSTIQWRCEGDYVKFFKEFNF